jgi:hypothetical protein
LNPGQGGNFLTGLSVLE